MKSRAHSLLVWSFLAFFPALLPAPAHATLGGQESSINADQRALHARQKDILIYDSYQVREIETSAQTVREYISSDGTVFAVTWKGKNSPNLAQLLGSYYAEFLESEPAGDSLSASLQSAQSAESENVATEQKSKVSRSARKNRASSANLIAEQSGPLHDLHGRAYLPHLLPKGVDAGEIR